MTGVVYLALGAVITFFAVGFVTCAVITWWQLRRRTVGLARLSRSTQIITDPDRVLDGKDFRRVADIRS